MHCALHIKEARRKFVHSLDQESLEEEEEETVYTKHENKYGNIYGLEINPT